MSLVLSAVRTESDVVETVLKNHLVQSCCILEVDRGANWHDRRGSMHLDHLFDF